MITVPFNATGRLPVDAQAVLRWAKQEVFGNETVEFVPSIDPGALRIRPTDVVSFPRQYLVASLLAVSGRLPRIHPFDCDDDKVLYFDIESHNEGRQWGMAPDEFFRLGQWAWGPTGDVYTTTDYREFMELFEDAEGIVGANIHAFDLSVLYGKDSTVPLEMARDGRVFDTMVFANLAFPAPETYHTRNGEFRKNADTPGGTLKWLSLDNLSFQLNLPGKLGDLREIAKRYNPPKTKVDDLDYSLIPTDDPEFLQYAVQDVRALQDVVPALMTMKDVDAYDWREQTKIAIDAQITRNGFRLDVETATKRRDDLAANRDRIILRLQEEYGLPTEGLQPWKSTAGIAAIWNALADHDIHPKDHPTWPKTKTGFSLGGDVLKDFTEGTSAEALGLALAEVMGQRPLSQQALDNLQPDGKVHPQLTSLQRSGRTSVSKPGLTVWTSRGPGIVEKSYFIADNDDECIVGFDFSQADSRIVAAYSGDVEFLKRFAPGVDAHVLTARVVFGEKYEEDPDKYRQKAKSLGHAYAYRAKAAKLAETSGEALEVAQMFVTKMDDAYPDVTKWQNKVTREGSRGQVINDWGRRMVINPHHAYTQAPAMYGQSGTRELMVDAMIRMLHHDIDLIKCIKVPVHDELIFSLPKRLVKSLITTVVQLMSCSWGPREGGQVVDFPVSYGGPARTWEGANH